MLRTTIAAAAMLAFAGCGGSARSNEAAATATTTGSGAGGNDAGVGSGTGGAEQSGGTETTGPSSSGIGGETDASGGTGSASAATGGTAGTGGTNGAGGGAGAECGILDVGPAEPPQVVLLLDRSASMTEPLDQDEAVSDTNPVRWDLLLSGLQTAMSDSQAEVAWGLKVFPAGVGLGACASEGNTDAIQVPVATMNGDAMWEAISSTEPFGDGTPTGHAVGVAADYLDALADNAPKYVLLTTDGQPSCNADNNEDVEDGRAYAIEVLTAAAIAGIHTYVLGIPTNDSAISSMNDMADAGREGRNVGILEPRFYPVDLQRPVATSMSEIVNRMLSCAVSLAAAPLEPDNVSVSLGGEALLRDQSQQDGWNFVGEDHTAMRFFGAACDSMVSLGTEALVIEAGC